MIGRLNQDLKMKTKFGKLVVEVWIIIIPWNSLEEVRKRRMVTARTAGECMKNRI